jgi:hypothetical protein
VGSFSTLAKTEVIKNNLNPDFAKVPLMYFFERPQKLKFVVLDINGKKAAEVIGWVETTMGQIMGSKGQTFTADLVIDNPDKKNRG